MSDRVVSAVQAALQQTLTITEYEEFLQQLLSQAAVTLSHYQGTALASSYVKGISSTLNSQLLSEPE